MNCFSLPIQVFDLYFRHINGSYIQVEDLDEDRRISLGLGEEENDVQSPLRRKRDLQGQSSSRYDHKFKRIKRDLGAELFNALSLDIQEVTFKPSEMLSTKLNTTIADNIVDGIAMTIEFDAATLPWENETKAMAPKPTFSVYIGRDFVPNKYYHNYALNLTSEEDRPREEEIVFMPNK